MKLFVRYTHTKTQAEIIELLTDVEYRLYDDAHGKQLEAGYCFIIYMDHTDETTPLVDLVTITDHLTLTLVQQEQISRRVADWLREQGYL